MSDVLVESLEAQVAELQQMLQQAEADGAEIARNSDQTIVELEAANRRLQEESNPVYCRGCEKKRRQAAAVLTLFWLNMYIGDLEITKKTETPGEFFGTLIMIFLPFFLVVCRWYVLLYLKRYNYRGWKDNDITRGIMRWWDNLPAF